MDVGHAANLRSLDRLGIMGEDFDGDERPPETTCQRNMNPSPGVSFRLWPSGGRCPPIPGWSASGEERRGRQGRHSPFQQRLVPACTQVESI